MKEFVVRAVENGLYLLQGTGVDSTFSIPADQFGSKLAPVGTTVRITFGVTDPDVIRHNGEFYGYPPCCIEHCATRLGRPSPEQREAAQGTGFIPCPACTQLVLAGKPLHELLLPSRKASFPFKYPRRLPPV